MKLAISNIAWNAELNYDIYELMLKHHINSLEIAPSKFFPQDPYTQSKESMEYLKQFFKDKNFVLPSMQSILYGRPDLMLFESHETRQKLW